MATVPLCLGSGDEDVTSDAGSYSCVCLAGAWGCSGGEQGAVPADAGGGATAAGVGLQRSGRDHRRAGGTLGSSAREGGEGTRQLRQKKEIEKQVRDEKERKTENFPAAKSELVICLDCKGLVCYVLESIE